MPDPRIDDYARLLVDTCVDPQPGWQVYVTSSPLARPLFEAVTTRLGQRGCYVISNLAFDNLGPGLGWLREAPEELVREPPPIIRHIFASIDALIGIQAPENTRTMTTVPPERLQLLQQASRMTSERMLRHEIPWVGCQYPTPALAQEAGMSTDEFADFLYGACLLDWDAERKRMQAVCDSFDAADEVRIVADATDLTLSLRGRTGKVDAGGANIPGGEFFFCPVEDSATGTIAFTEFPAVYVGREVGGIRLRFEGGRVVDASADREHEFLPQTLDIDEGARRVGELGIGCNPGINRFMKNTLFDEKIDGTVHLALGNGFPDMGGENVSAIHWDIVKDLRKPGTLLELDGEVVQRDGAWLIPAV
jgi:aminopeptidase